MEKHLGCEGCVVHYEVHGEGNRDTLILLHGYGVNRRMWQPQLETLAGYRVIVPDIRGHGQSRPCADFTVPAAADDIARIAAVEGAERPLLVGLSMGGYIVQEYALRHPDRTGGCMIVGATPIFARYPLWEKLALRYSAALLALYPWQTLQRAMVNASALQPDARQALAEMFAEMTKQEFITSWHGIATCLHEVAMTFPVPLHVACGEHDKTGTIRQRMGDWPILYPGCIVRQIPNAAHVANMDAPEAFNQLLHEFIAACLERGLRHGKNGKNGNNRKN